MSKWMPTRKWWAATITGAGTLGVAIVEATGWNDTLTIAVIGFAVQRALSYVLPNGPETATRRRRRARPRRDPVAPNE